MYKKSKRNQSRKLEKENDNTELHKHIKRSIDKCSDYNKKETVWDRLTKFNKESSNTSVLRSNGNSKTSQYFQAIIPRSINVSSTQHVRTPFTVSHSSAYKNSNFPERISKRIITEKKIQSLVQTIPLKNIIDRSLSDNLKYTADDEICHYSNESVSKEIPFYNNQTVDQNSQDSNDEYKLAPLMKSLSFKNIYEFLQHKEKSMNLEDIESLKNIIELDYRCDHLLENPEVIKDILKTQLEIILKNESVVKKVLKSLDSSTSLIDSFENKSVKQFNDISSYSDRNVETQKIKVEVIFKNVPTLEKEIKILKTLGEKLEATLRKNKYDRMLQRNVGLRPTKVLQMSTDKYRHIKYEVYVLPKAYKVMHSVEIIGLCHFVEIVEEFSITQKSLIELKQDSCHQFYIPSNSGSVRWIRTSFKNLMKTPNELITHINPKSSQIGFNVLEQDSIFFKNPFHKTLELSNNYKEKNKFTMKQLCCDGGDWYFSGIYHDDKIQKFSNIVRKSKPFNNIASKLLKTTSVFEATGRHNQCKCTKHYLTPIPINNNFTPKNNLLKTILFGFVQIMVFIMLIIALTFPDLKC